MSIRLPYVLLSYYLLWEYNVRPSIVLFIIEIEAFNGRLKVSVFLSHISYKV